jgi:formate hydrogenlyase subunit 4
VIFVLATLTQLLHIALVLAVAPLAIGLQRWIAARLAGRTGAPPWQAWRDLRRLARKPAALADSASTVSRAAPLVCFATAAVAATLVPSFTLGMAFAPMADLLVVLALLGATRLALALAALDPGTAVAGQRAARSAAASWLAEPALLLVTLGLGLAAGTTNLDLLVGQLHQGLLQPPAAAALAAAALLAVALATPRDAAETTEFAGGELALLQMAEALRRLAWWDLVAALFLPLGMAPPDAGPLAWLAGLLAWGVKLLVLIGGMTAWRCATGPARASHAPQLIGTAALLGLLAALLALASAAAA